jgi:Ca2+-binding EF-hand superfamily protein
VIGGALFRNYLGEALDKLVATFDEDGDGEINIEEWVDKMPS